MSSLLAKTTTIPSPNSFLPSSTNFLNSFGGRPSTFWSLIFTPFISSSFILFLALSLRIDLTNKLTEKYDAVKFVKVSSEIIGGQGGGGRKDFAQAGGQDHNKINEAFEKIKSLI